MLRVPIQLKLDGAPDAAALEDLRLPVPGDGPVTLSRPGPGLWQLAVQDQGHGIPEAQRE
ncbi:MAG: hypothetical protein FJ086_19050, partial [Deltaproteobacteria bacterium]|nr:hypothetical protein [Deltaproteobacteria bacterium]